MNILEICTGAGLWGRAWVEAGHDVTAGCEIMEHKRRMYSKWCGDEGFVCHDLVDLPDMLRGLHFDLITGGPSCQAHTRLKSLHKPKFPDLTPLVNDVLNAIPCDRYLFENVVPIDIPGAATTKLNAMNFPTYWKGRPIHQSRPRWFTHSPDIVPPPLVTLGTIDELMAYSIVVGRHYGPKRGAILQGWPEFANLDEPCVMLQEALADGVPRGLADVWIKQLEQTL